MVRGVGYCENVSGCADFAKGVFLLNPGKSFFCPRCREQGSIARESLHRQGGPMVGEVRVEFNHDPLTGAYREVAIVRDDAAPAEATGVATWRKPTIRTEKRAMMCAEAELCSMNLGEAAGAAYERRISWDGTREEVAAQTRRLFEAIGNSGFYTTGPGAVAPGPEVS